MLQLPLIDALSQAEQEHLLQRLDELDVVDGDQRELLLEVHNVIQEVLHLNGQQLRGWRQLKAAADDVWRYLNPDRVQ
jgi:hypothetical protein